jgi:hypothetical protein
MKVTRRELVALIAAATAVAQETPEEQQKRNTDALDQFELKQETEPAFAFKA